jgi:predicted ATPase
VAAEIARSLDGIPLAIELAAARAAVLSPAQIRARLTAPLDVLAQRDDGGRHASMRRAIGDSYAQLRDADKACLARCAFFRGGFTLDAAERVIGPALAEIEALAGRSLLRASDEPDGGVRFSMYETIREFALERLSPDEQAEIARAHCRTYAEIGEARATLFAARRRERAALERELDNLMLAHATAEAWAAREPAGDAPALLLSLSLALDAVLAAHGLPLERRRALDAALATRAGGVAATGRGAGVSLRVRALVARGRAWHELGGFDRAREDLGAACDVARAIDDAALEALASLRLGEVVELSGSTADARRLFAHALLLLAGTPPSPERDLREAEALLRVGHAHRREGDLDEAERETARAVSLHRELGDDEGLAGALYEAATIALFRRQYELSEARFQEGLELARRVDARTVEAALTTAAGTLALERGDLDAALDRHTRGVALFREIGNRYREGSALYYLAQTYGLRAAPDEATQLLRRALPIVQGAGVPRYVALIEGYRAALAADAGDAAGAREALAAARAALDACPGEPTLAAALDVHALHVAYVAASPDARAALLERARAIPGDCDDPRFALRLLELRAAPLLADERVLAVTADAGRFRAPGCASWVDLETRAPLRRILAALAKERGERPGDGLAVEQLVAAGWPGERIGYAAATNRVHVALATLRKLGLRDVLVRGEGGYLLSPAVRLAVTA